jgi:2,3-bisphosphoglycerate-independent phosphoglycerate mutase
LKIFKEYRVLILCDHFTPISVMTHTPEPVPFIIYPGPHTTDHTYTEKQAKSAGLYLENGHTLINLLLGNAA